jgi:ABC-type transporter Mla subunit MlaD
MTSEEWIEFLKQSIASHDRQIAELVENGARLDARIAAQSANIDKLVQVTNQDAEAIRALAAIAERHERRLDDIQG